MEIRYTRSALKALLRVPASEAKRIRGKIGQYARDPPSLAGNVKKLKGRPGYRLRVGNYRVIFDRDGVVMEVLHIGHRGSVYED